MGGKGDMNGLWSGWYAYSGLSEPVPFTAWVDDTRGTLTGTILEPNTFSPFDLDDLQADMNGARIRSLVMFTKIYRPNQGAHDCPIQYSGTIDLEAEMIRGNWSIVAHHTVEGRFEMRRASRGISEGILRHVLAPVER